MFDGTTARSIALGELAVMKKLVEDIAEDAWRTPTSCAGWTVADVCSHAGLAAKRQAEGFRRAAQGVLEPPEFPGAPELDPGQIRELLADGASELDAALADLRHDVLEGLTPMPFGVVPTMVALQVTVYEYAFHAEDVRSALGAAGAIPADVAAAFFGFLPGLAPMMAARAEPGAPTVGYRLAPTGGTAVDLAPGAKGWEIRDGQTGPSCTIAGPDDAVALFVMGRIGPEDPRLAITGETAAAGEFKRWFPGP